MHERQRWGRWRYAALLSVFALHIAVLTVLVMVAKTRFLATPIAAPVELMILPQNPAPAIPQPPALSDRRKKIAATPRSPPSDALTAVTPNARAEVAGPPIDWSQEAQDAAASIAKGARVLSDAKAAPQAVSPFAAPPPHHKGEQFPGADGTWIVYVSDDCYQVSKSITSITNATNNGMGLQTYCQRHS